ncbi:MAG: Ketose-bisphosphate aldolase, class-II [Parcubacteria group bacterium GW2011_GWF1_45_5]|nr:MAG: Ketose-bisphosphate aldolase, class-II [Parcubacteria group bacterium GW2011_GWF1_45_5]
MERNLRQYSVLTTQDNFAIGHFNVSNWEGVKAIQEACAEANTPIIIGVSQGEAEFMGIETIAAIVRAFREKMNLPVFLNADHFKDMAMVESAAKAGFDSILFDAASDSWEDNIAKTKQAVDLVKSINPNILVEGELGYIGVGSVVRDKIPEGAVIDESFMTTPEQAKEFVLETGVDLIGPAVGNIHGIVKGYKENININRITSIRAAVETLLVLHGASGIGDELLRQAVKAGISIIHINTELRVVWKDGLTKSLKESGDEVAPYKILKPVVSDLKQLILHKVGLFHG